MMIFLGGAGRLLSLSLTGMPVAPFVGFALLEVLGAPLFVWWQARVVRLARGMHDSATIVPNSCIPENP